MKKTSLPLALFISQFLNFSIPQFAAGAAATGDPLAGVRRVAGKNTIESSGALETVMLLAQLASGAPPRSDFQTQARARFASHASHPAVRETAALMERGFGYQELARFAMLMTAPYFVLEDSEELKELAAVLPSANGTFNLDRLHGYAKLVREFYWDNHVGQFLRSSVAYYQKASRIALPSGAPLGARVLFSPLAPETRFEFKRPPPRSATYWVWGN